MYRAPRPWGLSRVHDRACSGQCGSKHGNGGPGSADSDCTSDICMSGSCRAGIDGDPCNDGSDCPGASNYCKSGTCRNKVGNGGSCDVHADCQTNSCLSFCSLQYSAMGSSTSCGHKTCGAKHAAGEYCRAEGHIRPRTADSTLDFPATLSACPGGQVPEAGQPYCDLAAALFDTLYAWARQPQDATRPWPRSGTTRVPTVQASWTMIAPPTSASRRFVATATRVTGARTTPTAPRTTASATRALAA